MSEKTQPASLEGENLERLQALLLEMLGVLDDACRKLDVPYWIDSGTCLGAVRHGGFIPWDDDIDVGMMVDDWRRFIVEAPAILPPGYSIHTPLDTPGVLGFWAWLWKDGTRFIDPDHQASGCQQAVFIDLFPFIALDADPRVAERQRKELQLWQGLKYVRTTKNPSGAKGLVEKVAPVAHEVLQRAVSDEWLAERFWKATKTDNPGDMIINPSYTSFAPLPRDVMLPPSPIQFAGMTVSGPHDPLHYLELKYGDWQKLPPEDKRHTHAPLILDFGDGVNVVEQG